MPKSKPDLKDDDIARMFNEVPLHVDSDIFEARVMMKLNLKLWLRQGLVVLAGIVGGVYALAQFIRLPEHAFSSETFAEKALSTEKADSTLRAGIAAVDGWTRSSVDLLAGSAPYINFMQTPLFFWLSFALCVGFLALYFAWSQEEAL